MVLQVIQMSFMFFRRYKSREKEVIIMTKPHEIEPIPEIIVMIRGSNGGLKD